MRQTALRVAAMLSLFLLLLTPACRRESSTPTVSESTPGDLQPTAGREKSAATVVEPGESNDPQADLARRLASYELENADKSPLAISSLHGKAVLLNVWATWCGPCRAEIPQLNQLVESSAKDGLEVVGISIDAPGTEPQVLGFGVEHKIGYRIAFDSKEKIADVMQTTVIPTTVLLDREGRVVLYVTGLLDTTTAQFQQALRQALRK
ncbi:MAG TPA: TlpA disulfide reductase family protein [Thermoanaerobaculia bacterium]|nr:TlpA disulfide reductase family protein [Thermoanaerobaculia bacterium]